MYFAHILIATMIFFNGNKKNKSRYSQANVFHYRIVQDVGQSFTKDDRHSTVKQIKCQIKVIGPNGGAIDFIKQ